jgi:hypothetical protein
MHDESRAAKTRDKTRHGGLPAPTEHTRRPTNGDGRPCDGCAETIHRPEPCFSITVYQALECRLHRVCYDAWVTFKR